MSFLRKFIVMVKFLVCHYCSLYLVIWFHSCLFVFLYTFFLDNLCVKTKSGLICLDLCIKTSSSGLGIIKTTFLWPKGVRFRLVPLYSNEISLFLSILQEIRQDELMLNDDEALIPVGHYYKVCTISYPMCIVFMYSTCTCITVTDTVHLKPGL